MGCVTMTYNAPLRKYLMCVTDGGNTCAKMNTYILESTEITGPWKLVTYLKDFGEQAYFVNIPSKFISSDGRTAWLWYSGNFAKSKNGMSIQEIRPGAITAWLCRRSHSISDRSFPTPVFYTHKVELKNISYLE